MTHKEYCKQNLGTIALGRKREQNSAMWELGHNHELGFFRESWYVAGGHWFCCTFC